MKTNVSSKSSNTRRSSLSVREKLCYGLGDVSNGLAVSSVSVWFLYYLTDVAGLGAFLAGVAVTVGRLWDAVTDPIMGWIADHTRSRWGKRLPYLLFGAIPYALSYLALWVVPEFESERSTFIYVTVALIAFNTCLTVVFVPYTSLTAAITNSYDERTSVTGYRMVCSQIAFLIGAALPPAIVAWVVDRQELILFDTFFGSWAGTAREGHALQAGIFALVMVA
ncbi:MAG: MFS transporter, partial [Bdellovibrionales bacterium]|nr:MFS transporter [Bdellovibrionales bacterium]